MKKRVLGALFLATSIIMVGCNDEASDLTVKTSTPLETTETFFSNYFFDKGTYEQYKEVSANPESLITEDEFTSYRESNDAASELGKDIKTFEDALAHLKVKEIDETNAEVHFVQDVNDEEFKTTRFYWVVEKHGDQWLMN